MAGSDMSAADLLADEQVEVGDDDGDDDSTVDFLERMFDTLDERGYLDAMLAQQLDLDGMDANAPTEAVGDADGAGDPTAAGGGVEVDADAVAQFGKLVIDNMGDIPMSKVVKLAENNPQTVNQVIEQAVGGGEQRAD